MRKAAGREEDLQRTLREAQDSLGNAPKDAPEREAALERKARPCWRTHGATHPKHSSRCLQRRETGCEPP